MKRFRQATLLFVRGERFHPGRNVSMGKDHTIFSLIDGFVKFSKRGPLSKNVIDVVSDSA